MSFLLDTDICSAYLKQDPRVVKKAMQYFGGLHVSVVTVGELHTWARRKNASSTRLQGVRAMLAAMNIEEIRLDTAEMFGELRGMLFDQGRPVGELDLLNAAVARVKNLTMVTHNTQDYEVVPQLILDDWLSP